MALKGMRVFISRKDFPPQFIESTHDMLKENGAEVCICANPSCNESTDFHVLPTSQHERIAEYLTQGCNVIGPDCLAACTKEHRPFPRNVYTCCLAMEGVKVLATGFEKAEKAEIERLVSAMCGEVETKAVTNVSFFLAKDVLAAKYKFAVNNLKRPILRLEWLYQCWREHRLVPWEPFRLPPFAGLTLCATNIPLEERREIEEACIQNGGFYSADLTRKCTHLIASIPQGDKFRVARRWGTVKIVNRQWFAQCLAAKTCLDEDLFPVNAGKEKAITVSQTCGPPLVSPLPENVRSEVVVSSATSGVSNSASREMVQPRDSPSCLRFEAASQENGQSICLKINEGLGCDEDNMYLSNCRMYLAGFAPLDLRKYVSMVRHGGGTRHMELNDRVTHVIVGKVTDSQWKELRQMSGMNSMQVLWPLWLEECHQLRREVAITQKHVVPDGLPISKSKPLDMGSMDHLQQQSLRNQPRLSSCQADAELDQSVTINKGIVQDKDESIFKEDTPAHESHIRQEKHVSQLMSSGELIYSGVSRLPSSEQKLHEDARVSLDVGVSSSSAEMACSEKNNLSKDLVFKGCMFAICDTFPEERREEIVQWVIEGGGVMAKQGGLQYNGKRKVDFLVVSHGTRLSSIMMVTQARPVSSHWIRFCLEEKVLLSLDSHVLYQPLQCQVPFPGLQAARFCVSQFEEKERLLLRNLCFVLGVKYTEKLTKKVTHLLCKVKDGLKYEAACIWGIYVTTADWLFTCVSKDKVLPLVDFQPRELSPAEKDAGVLGMTQCPSQAAHLAPLLASGTSGCQRPTEPDMSQSQETKRVSQACGKASLLQVDASVAYLSERNKYALSMQTLPSQHEGLDPWDEQTARWSGCADVVREFTSADKKEDASTRAEAKPLSPCNMESIDHIRPSHLHDIGGPPADSEQQISTAPMKENHPGSDVAAAIEGLLAQTSKLKSNDGSKSIGFDQEISPEHTKLKRTREEPHFKRPPKLQAMSTDMAEKSNTLRSPLREFDESQMESQQVIGYDEDHTGRQLIMERVRTRSMASTDSSSKPARQAAAWKNDGLGRLFKVAEAMK